MTTTSCWQNLTTDALLLALAVLQGCTDTMLYLTTQHLKSHFVCSHTIHFQGGWVRIMTQHNLQPHATCAVAPTRHTFSLPAVIAAHAPESEGCMQSGQLCTLWALEGISKQSCVRLVSVCGAK